MQIENPMIVTAEQMRAERDRLVNANQTLVFTNGCFDILHRGHVTYLTFARNQGDALVVGINSDASVKRNKGQDRPINQEWDRAHVLASLRAVDYVVIFDDDEPKELITKLLPQVLVKGKDWAHYVSGREIVEAHGGKVVLADMVEGRSTTTTIDRVVQVYGSKPQGIARNE
jgi:D-glycero-beta-D-manno-heptose 1-phosphate adenylyltransferase